MSDVPLIIPEEPADHDAVDGLIEAAFGPGRLAKTAERLREGNHPAPGLSVVAKEDGVVVGCARLWLVKVGQTPAILLGPFAVAESMRSRGLGQALVEAACARARDAGHALIILVGDGPYFAKLGFERVGADVRLPGPVDMRRVLVLPLKAGAAKGLAGMLAQP